MLCSELILSVPEARLRVLLEGRVRMYHTLFCFGLRCSVIDNLYATKRKFR